MDYLYFIGINNLNKSLRRTNHLNVQGLEWLDGKEGYRIEKECETKGRIWLKKSWIAAEWLVPTRF